MHRIEADDEQEPDDLVPPVTVETPYVAKLVELKPQTEAEHPAEVRAGSPFRVDPAGLPAVLTTDSVTLSGEVAYGKFGPFLYTAMGASSAAVVVLVFAAAGAQWFPAGGALVAILGTTLSIVGLFSTKRFRYAAITALPLHLMLFLISYARTLS